MVVAEIHDNQSGLWVGQLCEWGTGEPIGAPWIAKSRSELIGKMRSEIPLTHLSFRDTLDPLDP